MTIGATLRVRMLTERVSPAGLQYVGDVVELPEAEARRLIVDRQAEPAVDPEHGSPRTAALASPATNAARRRPSNRRIVHA